MKSRRINIAVTTIAAAVIILVAIALYCQPREFYTMADQIAEENATVVGLVRAMVLNAAAFEPSEAAKFSEKWISLKDLNDMNNRACKIEYEIRKSIKVDEFSVCVHVGNKVEVKEKWGDNIEPARNPKL